MTEISIDHSEREKQTLPLEERLGVLDQIYVVDKIKEPLLWTLSGYVSSTDEVIGKLDGSIPLQKMTVFRSVNGQFVEEKKDLPPPSDVIYLDKSARPVEWFVREFWPLLSSPGTDGEEPQLPQSRFLNIDKDDWLRRIGVPEKHIQDAPDSLVDFSKIDHDLLTRLRSIFSTVHVTEDSREEVWNHPTQFDGKHVMILDEVKSSGQTIRTAQQLLTLAYPEATFSGSHWMIPELRYLNPGSTENFAMKRVPPWYSNVRESGRGVSDKSPLWHDKAEALGQPVSEKSKIGYDFLSTPPHHPHTFERIEDTLATKLRQDIKTLAKAVADHEVLYRPSPTRIDAEDEKIIERIEHLNDMSFDAWKIQRDAQDPKKSF